MQTENRARGLHRQPLIAALAAVTLAVSIPQAACRGGERPPSIILIYVDDMGWAGLSSYGNPNVRTVHLDRLAEQGVRFTQAYAPPMCSPSRAALLSGQYPARLKITRALPGRDVRERAAWKVLQTPMPRPMLPFEHYTLAEALDDRGYATAFLGKWHLGTADGGSGYSIEDPEDLANIRAHYGFDHADPGEELDRDKGVSDLTDKAIAFIEEKAGQPFFLFLSHHTVHTLAAAPQPVVDEYLARGYPATGDYPYEGIDSATYLAMIEHLDTETGRLLARLDSLGLADDTVVIFLSDNGGAARVTRNGPLRRGKGTLYEGGIRVPLLIRWPRQIPPGRTSDLPVHVVDVYPTLLAIAGAEQKQGQVLDGESLLPLLRDGERPSREALFFHIPHYIVYPKGHFRTTPHGAVRRGKLKLVEHFADHFRFPPGANSDSVIYDPNLAEYVPERRVELFDLEKDVGERHDLADVLPDQTEELLKLLDGWRRAVDADMPVPNPDYDPAARFVSEFDSARARAK